MSSQQFDGDYILRGEEDEEEDTAHDTEDIFIKCFYKCFDSSAVLHLDIEGEREGGDTNETRVKIEEAWSVCLQSSPPNDAQYLSIYLYIYIYISISISISIFKSRERES